MKPYAEIKWVAEDIEILRPNWPIKKCEQWLEENKRRIEGRSIELGWEIIEDLLFYEDMKGE